MEKKLESFRKDIEDVSSVIKGRFRLLKLPTLYLSDGCFHDGDGGQFWGRPRVKHSNGMMELMEHASAI